MRRSAHRSRHLLQGAAVAAPPPMLPVPDAAADPAPDREVLVVEEPAGPDAVPSMPEAMPEAVPPPLPVAAPLLPAPMVTLPEAAPGRPEAAEAAPVAASGPSGARRPLEATDRIASAAPAAPGAAPRLSMTDPGAIPSSQPMARRGPPLRPWPPCRRLLPSPMPRHGARPPHRTPPGQRRPAWRRWPGPASGCLMRHRRRPALSRPSLRWHPTLRQPRPMASRRTRRPGLRSGPAAGPDPCHATGR